MLLMIVSLCLVALFLMACGEPQGYMGTSQEQSQKFETMKTGLANPASEHCIKQGFSHTIKTDDKGGQYGVCTFHDGSWCEEWAYYRGNCYPGINMTLCNKQFWGKTVCPGYDPVCGYDNFTQTWDVYNNDCSACIADNVIGYRVGDC